MTDTSSATRAAGTPAPALLGGAGAVMADAAIAAAAIEAPPSLRWRRLRGIRR